jgi:hypothetical protein
MRARQYRFHPVTPSTLTLVTRTSTLPTTRRKIAWYEVTNLTVDQALYRRVLIAPGRGRNVSSTTPTTVVQKRPHRPWEGSQRGHEVPFLPGHVASSSPLGGVATRPARRRRCRAARRPHRPWEGSQPRATRSGPRPCGHASSSPLGGVATVRGAACRASTSSPHRPWEGSQPLVLEAETLGLNTTSSPLGGVLTQ